jgi:hypothetical protein
LLRLTDDEADAVMAVANGPHSMACTSDDGLIHLFSQNAAADREQSWIDFHRAHAVSCLAMVLGSNPISSYYYTCMFITENLPNTNGLGSGYGTISKDCGYQTKFKGRHLVFDDHTPNPAGPPFAQVVRRRALNNYLIWASISWGMWIRMQKRPELFPHFKFTTTHPDDIAYGKPLTEIQKVASTILARANSFLSMLTTDKSLSRSGVDVDLYLTMCMFYTGLQMSQSVEVFNMFNRDDATCVQRQARCMEKLSEVWTQAENDGAQYRAHYMSSQSFAIEIVSRFRNGLQYRGLHTIELPDKTAVQTMYEYSAPDTPEGEVDTDNSDDMKLNRVIKLMLNKLEALEINSHIPVLVRFYKWIHSNFAYRIHRSEKDILVKDALIKIDDITQRKYGESLMHAFVKSWNIVAEKKGELNLCPTARRAGEGVIPRFAADDLLLSSILTIADDTSTGNYIINLLNDLMKDQNDLLLSSDLWNKVLKADGEFTLNKGNIVARNNAPDFHLMHLPLSASALTPSLICIENINELYERMGCLAIRAPTLQNDGVNDTEVISFDNRAAAIFLISMLVSGRPTLTLKPLLQSFRFIPDNSLRRAAMDINTVHNESKGGEIIEEVLEIPIEASAAVFDPCLRVAQQLEQLKQAVSFVPGDRPLEVMVLTRKLSDESSTRQCLESISHACDSILARIQACAFGSSDEMETEDNGTNEHKRSDNEDASSHSPGKHLESVKLTTSVKDIWQPTESKMFNKIISNLKIKYLIIFAEECCRIYSEMEYRFVDMQAGLKIELREDLSNAIQQSLEKILESFGEELTSALTSMRRFTDHLLSQQVISELAANSENLEFSVIKSITSSLSQLDDRWGNFCELFRQCKIGNTVSLLRLLFRFCTRAAAKSTSMENAVSSGRIVKGSQYIEEVCSINAY